MTFYTKSPLPNNSKPVEVPVTISEAAVAAFNQGFHDTFLVTWGRESKQASLNINDGKKCSYDECAALLSKNGINNIIIPDSGLTTQYINNLIQDSTESSYREYLIWRVDNSFPVSALMFTSRIMGSTTTWIVLALVITFIIKQYRKTKNI